YCTVRTAATFTLKISSTAPLISVLVALVSTRKVSTCPTLRPLFSSVESSFRMTLFSVTTGDFSIAQTPSLLISRRLLARFYGRLFCFGGLLHSLLRCGFFSFFRYLRRRLFLESWFGFRLNLKRRRSFFDSFACGIKKCHKLFHRRLRYQKLFVI